MWSHYANYHKGVCLKFAPEYDSEFFRLSLDVEYEERYPIIDLVNDELNVQISKAAKYKHIDWKYEEEVRVLDFYGHGLKKFNIASLREIIFGCKSTEEDRGYLIRLVSKLGYEHIKFKLAKMKSDEFALEFEEIDTGEINRTNETIIKEIDKYLDSELKQMMRDELKEMAEELYVAHVAPRYEELVRDAVGFLISLTPKKREKFIEERFPLNQQLLKELLRDWEEKNKRS